MPNAVLLSHVQTLLNAPDGGNSICAGGYNPFGSANTVSAACRAYLTTNAISSQAMRQDVAEGSLNGTAGHLPAGDLHFSLTATWRRDSYSALPDCHNRPSADAGCAGIGPADIASSVAEYPVPTVSQKVGEIAGEVLVPLLRDAPFAKSLNLDLGGRWSHYAQYGTNWTWRGEATWKPVSALMFRGGYERAVRVPSFAEAAIPITGSVASMTMPDPCSITSPATRAVSQITALCLSQMSPLAYAHYIQTSPAINAPIQGNTALNPEQADTYTLGAVLRPNWPAPAFSHLSLSVDYYAIHIANAIGLYPLAQNALADCFNLDAAHSNPTYSPASPFCQLIGRNGTGSINSIVQPYVNLGAIRTQGIDITLQWEADLGEHAGSIGIDSHFTRLLSYTVQSVPGGPLQDWAGTLGAGLLYSPATSGSTAPQPRWRGLTNLHYRQNGSEVSLRWRFISGMNDPNAIPGFSPPGTPDYSLFDLAAQLAINDGVMLRAGINNLFDRQPPTITYPGMTLGSVYDTVGRSYFVGIRASY
jgi:outer membrane receptor protein involved in Fe transport